MPEKAGSLDPIAEALAASPTLFPHRIDPLTGAVALIRLTAADYERASFLDSRAIAPGMASRTLPWEQLSAATHSLPERCNFIFHVGHVGSTLLSRLLGAYRSVFSLREPQVLRTLAQIRSEPQASWAPDIFEARMAALLKLLSRSFEPTQTPLVKATSFVSELAADFLARTYHPRAILMTVRPERFLATILGAENSPAEARMLAPNRLMRLHRRLGSTRWSLDALSPGEMVAMGWACEMTALADAAKFAGAQWLDFDRFLVEPHTGLATSLAHLGIAADAAQIDTILAGPDMQRYSKAPEHAYDGALREAVLNEAYALAGEEIRRGMAWLETAAAEFPPIQAALAIRPAP